MVGKADVACDQPLYKGVAAFCPGNEVFKDRGVVNGPNQKVGHRSKQQTVK